MTMTIMVQFDDEANILGELDGRFPIPIVEKQHAESVEISHAEMHTYAPSPQAELQSNMRG
jgi:hypothetical protein